MEYPCNTVPEIPLLVQVTRLRFQRVHTLLSSLDLHPGQYHLLSLIGETDGLSQNEIAARLYIKPSTLTVMITRMMRSGLVSRNKDARDSRKFRVHITPEGRKRLDQARSRFDQIERETFEGFSSEDFELFERAASRMCHNLLKANGEEDPACPWC